MYLLHGYARMELFLIHKMDRQEWSHLSHSWIRKNIVIYLLPLQESSLFGNEVMYLLRGYARIELFLIHKMDRQEWSHFVAYACYLFMCVT